MSSLLVPTVLENTSRGERAYDIYSRLLQERIIMVNGPIMEAMANLIVAQMIYLASQNSEREINLYISSHGGEVAAGLAIYDTMRFLNCPVATTCVGYAASFGTILLLAGDKGRRRALPHARIHMHQPLISGGIGGQATDLERIRHDTERDFFMSAQEAVEYGIIDEVFSLAEKNEEEPARNA
jgi:ATP-dependent Clp protease, protease subunit